MYKNFKIPFVISVFLVQFINGQNSVNEKSKHSISLLISHTQINEGLNENNKKQWLSLPSWGINYNYSLSEKWNLGVHTDIIIEDFKVESLSKKGEIIERSYPIASALVTSYKPNKYLSVLLGPGAELAKGHNFFLIRTGVEFGAHINFRWEFIANLINDYKFKAYNSWGIGVGLAYKL